MDLSEAMRRVSEGARPPRRFRVAWKRTHGGGVGMATFRELENAERFAQHKANERGTWCGVATIVDADTGNTTHVRRALG